MKLRALSRLPILGVLFIGSVVAATVMSGGLFDIVKSLAFSGGGNSVLSGGTRTVAHSIGQPSARAMSGGVVELSSGFHELQPGTGAAPFISTASAAPGAVSAGVFLGVPLTGAVRLGFSEAMLFSTLQAATTVTALRDQNGAPIQAIVPALLSYDAGTRTLTIQPAASWNSNHLFEVRVSTDAKSTDNVAMAAASSRQFQTVIDAALSNTVLDPLVGLTELTLPPQTLPPNAYVVIKTDPILDPDRASPGAIQEANAKIVRDLGGFRAPVLIREVNAYDSVGNAAQVSAPNIASLRLPFLDANGDGVVDGTVPPVRTASLALWTLDEAHRLWIRIPGSSVDPITRTVRTSIPHLSVFALIGTADTDVSQVFAFPVPWKPRANDAARYGTLQGGITFANLPSEGAVRIYTVSGELVRRLEIASGAVTLRWDGTNDGGEEVASGVYLWEIRAGENRKTGKLMVIW